MSATDDPATQSEQSFDSESGVTYTLEVAATLVATSRETIVAYCESGLLTHWKQSQSGYLLNDESLRELRQIEHLRQICGDNLDVVGLILELRRELDQLRSELRFRR